MFTFIPDTILRFAVDYSKPLSEMISAGDYYEVDSDINSERYATTRTDTVEYEAMLTSFGIRMSQGNVLYEAEQQFGDSWEPADIFQLLSFGEKFPDEQHESIILALAENLHDNRWQSRMSAPALDSFGLNNALRKLELYFSLGSIPAHSRFLFVRQVNN